jgi:hypothetical protein
MRILTATALLLLPASSQAAPALSERPPKWEYAELSYRTSPGRPAGVGADGTEVPATPASVSIRWVTGAGEVVANGWEELAEKLKAKPLKKGTAVFLKIQLLNHLGSEGWEVMEQQLGGGGLDRREPRPAFQSSASTTSSWLLKRPVP